MTIFLLPKICLISLLLSIYCNAKVYSYKEKLPNNIYNGKWKHECVIRIDFERRLLDLSKCFVLDSAEGFDLCDKDDFFIGTYYYSINNYDETLVKGGYQYVSMKFNVSSTGIFSTVYIKDIHKVRLRNPQWNLNFSEIRCNQKKARVFEIEHPYYDYVCEIPYKCTNKGYYAVDSVHCASLPPNAQRLSEEGFECKVGYLYKNEECVKKKNVKKEQNE